MDNTNINLLIRCVFCKSEFFALPDKNYKPSHGSFIVCANCGRENDFTSLVIIAKANAIEIAHQCVGDIVQDFKKKLGKTFGHSKIFKIS